MKNALFSVVVFAASVLGTAALADPSCGLWNWQSDGVYHQVCVNDDGSRHCYQASDANGSNAFEIGC
jgi:hypothetical protein